MSAGAEAADKPALDAANVDNLPMTLLGEATSIAQEDIEAGMQSRPVTQYAQTAEPRVVGRRRPDVAVP